MKSSQTPRMSASPLSSSFIPLPSSFSVGRGVRLARLSQLHAPTQSTFWWDESRPGKLLVQGLVSNVQSLFADSDIGLSTLDVGQNCGAQGRTQTFNLWFVGPALHQLSYSGGKIKDEGGRMKDEMKMKQSTSFLPSALIRHRCVWRSELESNQPLGFFRPALIRLSYPTRIGVRSLAFGL
jgi:hypothetical protein